MDLRQAREHLEGRRPEACRQGLGSGGELWQLRRALRHRDDGSRRSPVDRNGVGSAWVFTRSGNTWSKNPKRLSGFKEVGPGQFGDSVALAPNGNVVLVGGAIDNDGLGAAWTFAKSGSKWVPSGAKLVGHGAVGKQIEFGISVALSWTGAVAVIGGQGDANFAGAAWPFAAG